MGGGDVLKLLDEEGKMDEFKVAVAAPREEEEEEEPKTSKLLYHDGMLMMPQTGKSNRETSPTASKVLYLTPPYLNRFRIIEPTPVKAAPRHEPQTKKKDDRTSSIATSTECIIPTERKVQHHEDGLESLLSVAMGPVVHPFTCSHKPKCKNICGDCGKCFSQSGNLTTHIRIVHQGLKPFKCPYCEKGFSVVTSLKNHVANIHEGRKDHICEVCSKAFSEKGSLKRHMNSVHHDIRYTCPKCGPGHKGFSDRRYLGKHLRDVHGIRIEDIHGDGSLNATPLQTPGTPGAGQKFIREEGTGTIGVYQWSADASKWEKIGDVVDASLQVPQMEDGSLNATPSLQVPQMEDGSSSSSDDDDDDDEENVVMSVTEPEAGSVPDMNEIVRKIESGKKGCVPEEPARAYAKAYIENHGTAEMASVAVSCLSHEEESAPLNEHEVHLNEIEVNEKRLERLREAIDIKEGTVDMKWFKSNNQAGWQGVLPYYSKFKAYIYNVILGVFDTPEEAARAHAKAYIEKHGTAEMASVATEWFTALKMRQTAEKLESKRIFMWNTITHQKLSTSRKSKFAINSSNVDEYMLRNPHMVPYTGQVAPPGMGIQKVAMWNTKTFRKLSGNMSPLGANVEDFMRSHPHMVVYTGQLPPPGMAPIKTTMWNPITKQKISGNAAPNLENVADYTRRNPHMVVYTGQDRLPIEARFTMWNTKP